MEVCEHISNVPTKGRACKKSMLETSKNLRKHQNCFFYLLVRLPGLLVTWLLSAISGINRGSGLLLSEVCVTLSRGQPTMEAFASSPGIRKTLMARDNLTLVRTRKVAVMSLPTDLQPPFPQSLPRGLCSTIFSLIACYFTISRLTLLYADSGSPERGESQGN